MIAAAVTLFSFMLVGAAAHRALRFQPPLTLAGKLGLAFLTGIVVVGTLLFALGVAHVPITRLLMFAILALAGAVLLRVKRERLQTRTPGGRFARLVMVAPLLALFAIASVVPIRDYDGRVTWLPKAQAVALDGTLDGAYFQGQAGLNLHNRYPLLLPLCDAAVMLLCDDASVDGVRWLYALIAIAGVVVVGDLLALRYRRNAVWALAAIPWLPVFLAVDGGALSAYNDFAVFAIAGIALLLLDVVASPSGARVAALFLAALVLTKNEGVIYAGAVIVSVAVARRKFAGLVIPATSIAAAVALLSIWRTRVPAAYDEQYPMLLRGLPGALPRLPSAAAAIAGHALDRSLWGWFWVLIVVAMLICMMKRGRRAVVAPLLLIGLMAGVYTTVLAISSWRIEDLAPVAVPRLLIHLVAPAVWILAHAFSVVGSERCSACDEAPAAVPPWCPRQESNLRPTA